MITAAPANRRQVGGLRIDYDRHAVRAGDIDDPPCEDRNQHALRVIREDDRGYVVDGLGEPTADRLDFVGSEVEPPLDVEPHDLVAARHVTNFGRCRMALHSDEATDDSFVIDRGRRSVPLDVVPDRPCENRSAAEGHDVAGDVRCAAEHRVFGLMVENRDRRFGRDPRYFP